LSWGVVGQGLFFLAGLETSADIAVVAPVQRAQQIQGLIGTVVTAQRVQLEAEHVHDIVDRLLEPTPPSQSATLLVSIASEMIKGYTMIGDSSFALSVRRCEAEIAFAHDPGIIVRLM